MAYGNAYGGGYGDMNLRAPAVDSKDLDNVAIEQRRGYMFSPEYEREQFERGLQQQEQQRRMYDSETQRQKFGVLRGLLGGMGTPAGMAFGMTGSMSAGKRS